MKPVLKDLGIARLRSAGFLALSLGCAAIGALVLGDMMSARYGGVEVVQVVVARTEVPAGTALSANILEVRDWPAASATDDTFSSIAGLLREHDGATLAVGLLPGEPVVASRLSTARAGTGIAALLEKGLRAFALRVDDSIGETSLVYPGAFVDIIAVVRDPLGRGASAKVIVEAARVLSIGRDADVATRRAPAPARDGVSDPGTRGGTHITIEISAEEAEIVSVARNQGHVDVVLRNPSDELEIETPGSTIMALVVDGDKPKKAAKVTARHLRLRRTARRQRVADSSPDTGATSGGIEVYHAQ